MLLMSYIAVKETIVATTNGQTGLVWFLIPFVLLCSFELEHLF